MICWKQRQGSPVELFSNLKNLCISYPQYNYNTLNNYLSKAKIAYENDEVKIERKSIHTKPLTPVTVPQRSIMPIVVKRQLKGIDEKQQDLDYWLQQSPIARLSAVTFIVSQSLEKGERINKKIVSRKKMGS